MRMLAPALSLALVLTLLVPMLAEAQFIGKTTGRRKPGSPPPAAVEAKEEAAPVIGPAILTFLPIPVVVPIGDLQHPPGGPFNPQGLPVAGGEFYPRGLITEESGEAGVELDDYLLAPGLVTRKQYQLYLIYLAAFGDHKYCHPFEPPDKDHRPEGWFDLRICENPDQPITGIDWFDAFGFAAWAGARLVTDLEWERGGQSASAGEWLGGWYSTAWYEDPEAIRSSPGGPADGTIVDGSWTHYQTMAVRQADGSRSWRNIYSRCGLGFRLAWDSPEEGSDGDGDPVIGLPDAPVFQGAQTAETTGEKKKP